MTKRICYDCGNFHGQWQGCHNAIVQEVFSRCDWCGKETHTVDARVYGYPDKIELPKTNWRDT